MKTRGRANYLPLYLAGLAVATPVWAQNDTQTKAPAEQSLIYKSDPQRTNSVAANLGAIPPNLLWSYTSNLSARISDTTPLVIGPPGRRRIYMALDAHVLCIDGQTGQQIWRSKPLAAPISSPLAMLASNTGDQILAVTNNGKLHALRTSDGGVQWQADSDPRKSVSVLNTAPVFVKTPEGDRIVIAQGTGRLVAFTPAGELDPKWEVVLGTYSTAPTATPAVSRDGQKLYLPTQDKRLWVINAATTKIEFPITMRASIFSSPVVTNEHLVVATDTVLNGLLLSNGRAGWVFDAKAPLSAPAARVEGAQNSTIFVGAANNKFYAINGSNGRVIWEAQLGDVPTGTPTVANDMIVTGTRNGVLYGLSPADGKIIWRYRLRSERIVSDRVLQQRRPAVTVAPEPADEAAAEPDAQPAVPAFGGGGFGGGGGAVPGGFGGGGFGGGAPGGFGGFGGFGGAPGGTGNNPMMATDRNNPPIWDDTVTQTYGVSGAPVVLEGQVYVQADNAALYAFGVQPFDADPPQLRKPQLSVLNTEGQPALQRLDAEKGWLGSGRGPVLFEAEIDDTGSGVDPSSIRVQLNQQELPAAAVLSFSDATGKLQVRLTEVLAGGEQGRLTDGNQTLTLIVRDYRGNELKYSSNFMVDNTLPQPAAETNQRGRGGFGGRFGR